MLYVATTFQLDPELAILLRQYTFALCFSKRLLEPSSVIVFCASTNVEFANNQALHNATKIILVIAQVENCEAITASQFMIIF